MRWLRFIGISMLGWVAVGAAGEVFVNLNVTHSVEGEETFDRAKFITMHSDINDGEWDSNEMREQFLEEYDVYLGRNNGAMPWHLSQTTEDPNKPGWPNLTQMASRGLSVREGYSNDASHQKYESRAGMMFGGQMSMFPNNRDISPPNQSVWQLEDYDAFAEFYSGFLTHFFSSGDEAGAPKPAFIEVLNEPFVAAGNYGTNREAVSDAHVAVAQRLKETHPDVMVGGYTAAHPMYEAADFNHWRNNWKLFIDRAGEHMDFFSVHLYDFRQDVNDVNRQYRVGSNNEAILDMIEAYSFIQLGEVKPFVISEYGFYSPGDVGLPYSRERDWFNVRSFSSMMMGLMEKPQLIAKSMPFAILKANWFNHESGAAYTTRLLRQKHEVEGETGNEWVYADIVQFYQLWSEVKGTRIDTTSNDQDLQVDAYVDGKIVYLILNNLEFEARDVTLNFFDKFRVPVASVSSKHSHANAEEMGVLVENEYVEAPQSVTLAAEGTMILKYEFVEALTLDETSEETKYYAKTYFQPIVANQKIDFEIEGVGASEFGEAVLRLGLGRDHGESLKPTLIVNGEEVDVTEDWRGYDQGTRERFFGVIEIPVPHRLIAEENDISVEFADAGGHVTSVALQVWEFSSRIRGEASEAFEEFAYRFDSERERLILETFGQQGKDYRVLELDEFEAWTEMGAPKPGTGRPLEFVVDANERKVLRIRATTESSN